MQGPIYLGRDGSLQYDGTYDATTDGIKAIAETVSELGKRTLEMGGKIAPHPHSWTIVAATRGDSHQQHRITQRLTPDG